MRALHFLPLRSMGIDKLQPPESSPEPSAPELQLIIDLTPWSQYATCDSLRVFRGLDEVRNILMHIIGPDNLEERIREYRASGQKRNRITNYAVLIAQ